MNRLVPHPYAAFLMFALIPVFLGIAFQAQAKKRARGGKAAKKYLEVEEDEWLGLVVQDISGEITAVQPGAWGDRQGILMMYCVVSYSTGYVAMNIVSLGVWKL